VRRAAQGDDDIRRWQRLPHFVKCVGRLDLVYQPAQGGGVKETKEARRERQAAEELQFVDVIIRAGNSIHPEVQVCKERKWRVDYLVNGDIALEIQGIGFGHHSFGAIMKTYEKNNAIAAQGWRLVQVTRAQVASGEALEALARCGVRVEAPCDVKVTK
jgi:hypothetical protein